MLQDNNAKIDVKALYLFSVCLKFTQKSGRTSKGFSAFLGGHFNMRYYLKALIKFKLSIVCTTAYSNSLLYAALCTFG
jgi:hypothetical protein